MIKEKKYVYAIDVMRVLAISSVLLVHTTTRTLEKIGYDLNGGWWTLFLNQIPSFAVALFFAISGFVLELGYNGHDNFLQYLQKRLSKIFIPYIFWSAIYYFFVYRVHSENFFRTLLTGDSSYQLYFIPSLMIMYLVFPFLHSIYKIITNRWSLIVLGVIQVAILYHDYYVHNLQFSVPVNYVLFNYYVFILGMYVSQNQEKTLMIIRKLRVFLVLSTVFFALEIFLQGKNIYFKTYNIDAFYSRHRPSILFYTISLFSIIYLYFNRPGFGEKIIRLLSRLSFFVFFVHVIVLEQVWQFVGLPIFSHLGKNFYSQLWFDPLFFGLVGIISFGIAYAAHKIPYLNKVTG